MALDTRRFDFALDDSGDLFFTSLGDLSLVPSDNQLIEDNIIAGPNWWKNNPNGGANLGIYLNGPTDIQFLTKVAILSLMADGYNVSFNAIMSILNQLIINIKNAAN